MSTYMAINIKQKNEKNIKLPKATRKEKNKIISKEEITYHKYFSGSKNDFNCPFLYAMLQCSGRSNALFLGSPEGVI